MGSSPLAFLSALHVFSLHNLLCCEYALDSALHRYVHFVEARAEGSADALDSIVLAAQSEIALRNVRV